MVLCACFPNRTDKPRVDYGQVTSPWLPPPTLATIWAWAVERHDMTRAMFFSAGNWMTKKKHQKYIHMNPGGHSRVVNRLTYPLYALFVVLSMPFRWLPWIKSSSRYVFPSTNPMRSGTIPTGMKQREYITISGGIPIFQSWGYIIPKTDLMEL